MAELTRVEYRLDHGGYCSTHVFHMQANHLNDNRFSADLKPGQLQACREAPYAVGSSLKGADTSPGPNTAYSAHFC